MMVGRRVQLHHRAANLQLVARVQKLGRRDPPAVEIGPVGGPEILEDQLTVHGAGDAGVLARDLGVAPEGLWRRPGASDHEVAFQRHLGAGGAALEYAKGLAGHR